MNSQVTSKLQAFDGLLTEVNGLVSRTHIDQNAGQTHLLWVTVGLLIAQPKSTDFIYIDTNKKPGAQSDTSKRVRHGAYEDHYVLKQSFEDMMKRALSCLYEDLERFEGYGTRFDTYSQFIRIMDDRACKRMMREIRFIVAGCVVHGIEVTAEVYQYIYSPIVPELLMYRPVADKSVVDWLSRAQLDRAVFRMETFSLEDNQKERYTTVTGFSMLGYFTVNSRPSYMLPKRNDTQRLVPVARSQRLLEAKSRVRSVNFNQQTVKIESKSASFGVDLDATPKENMMVAEAAAHLFVNRPNQGGTSKWSDASQEEATIEHNKAEENGWSGSDD